MSGRVQVVGRIWWPNDVPAATSYSLSGYDIENMRGDDGKIARCDIEAWLSMNAGDFSSVQDFAAQIGSARYGWAAEDSEMVYIDCMYGEEA